VASLNAIAASQALQMALDVTPAECRQMFVG
jgi:hypothetical protein